MKRIGRSRKGFTLVEIVLVVAIIVILASVSLVGIKAMLDNANRNAAAVELHAGAWYIEDENGPVTLPGTSTKIKVVDRNTPGAKYWSDMDDMYAQVNNIMAPVPNIPAEQYNPGAGSGGNPVDPGTGGGNNPGNNPGGNPGGGNNSGGDNPGGGAVNPVEPEDPMWNGHPESWWDEHDAEIEKKIQEAINKGVDPNKIVVERDPETGHIINHYIPAASSGSNNSGAITVPNTVTSGTGVKNFTNNSDGTTTATLILNTNNTGEVKFRKEADGNYSIYCVGQDGHTVVGNAIGYTQDNQWCKENTWIKLTPADWAKLSSIYGFN